MSRQRLTDLLAASAFAVMDPDNNAASVLPIRGGGLDGGSTTTRLEDRIMDTVHVTYPHVTVKLVGTDGNAFALIGRVQKAIKSEVGVEAAREFANTAMSQGSYDDLLRFIMDTVEVQ